MDLKECINELTDLNLEGFESLVIDNDNLVFTTYLCIELGVYKKGKIFRDGELVDEICVTERFPMKDIDLNYVKSRIKELKEYNNSIIIK